MFKIDPDVLYSKADLAKALNGVTDVDRFLERIRPKSVIMGTYLGSDLIDALRAAPDYRDGAQGTAAEREARAKRGAASRQKKSRKQPADLISKDEVFT